jgi:hypothetical protein
MWRKLAKLTRLLVKLAKSTRNIFVPVMHINANVKHSWDYGRDKNSKKYSSEEHCNDLCYYYNVLLPAMVKRSM